MAISSKPTQTLALMASLLPAVLGVGCGVGNEEDACTPGATETCACPGTSDPGAQSCNSDGSDFGACSCGGAMDAQQTESLRSSAVSDATPQLGCFEPNSNYTAHRFLTSGSLGCDEIIEIGQFATDDYGHPVDSETLGDILGDLESAIGFGAVCQFEPDPPDFCIGIPPVQCLTFPFGSTEWFAAVVFGEVYSFATGLGSVIGEQALLTCTYGLNAQELE